MAASNGIRPRDCIDRDGEIVAKLDAIDDAHQIVEFGGALHLAGSLDDVRGVYRVTLPTGAIRRVSDSGGETLSTDASITLRVDFAARSGLPCRRGSQ